MRDPDRIPKMLEEIKELWSHLPDLRLGQLIINALTTGDHMICDPFYVEDDPLVRCIRTYVVKHTKTDLIIDEDENK